MGDYHDLSPKAGDEDLYDFIGWSLSPVPCYEEVRNMVGDSLRLVNSKQDLLDEFKQSWGYYPNNNTIDVYGAWLLKDSNEHIVMYDYDNHGTIYTNGETLNFEEFNGYKMLQSVTLIHEPENTMWGTEYDEFFDVLSYSYDNVTYNIGDSMEITASLPRIINISTTRDTYNNGDELIGTPNTPIAHKVFDGWYPNPDGTGKKYVYKGDLDGVRTLYSHYVWEQVTVTWPSGSYTGDYGETYHMPTNNESKEDEILATVTFDPDNGEAITSSNVVKQFIPSGWTEYSDNEEIILRQDITLVPEYSETIIGATFPEDPSKVGHTFDGWYYGRKYTSYSGTYDLELTAYYNKNKVYVFLGTVPLEYEYGDVFEFPPVPEIPDDISATVTFDPDNGDEPTYGYVYTHWIPYAWSLRSNNYTYFEGETITLTENIIGDSTYEDESIGVIFPDDPEKEHYTFDGWYHGNTEYTSYDDTVDITLTAHWTGDPINVCIEDGDCEEIPYGSSYNLGTNNHDEIWETIAEVTFKYHDNEHEDRVDPVEYYYTPNGWLVNGVHYHNDETIIITEETTIEYDYTRDISGVMIPTIPYRLGYDADGWFTEEEGGEKVEESYNYIVYEDQVLHLQWTTQTRQVCLIDECEDIPFDTEYNLGVNDIPKDDDIVSTVTFKNHNDEPDTVINVLRRYTPYAWKVYYSETNDYTEYDNNSVITIDMYEGYIRIEPTYYDEIVEAEFPIDDPVKDNYVFEGWYTEEIDGDLYDYSSYDGEEDLVLHAHWSGEPITVCIDSNCNEYPYGTELNLGVNNISKDDNLESTIDFNYHNGDDMTFGYVYTHYTPNGWLIDDIHYDDNAVITVTEDLDIYPDYTESIIGAEFPEDPEKEHYIFAGWFDDEDADPDNDTPYTEFDNPEYSVSLHAIWIGEPIEVCKDGDCEDVPYETEYSLGWNNISKPDEEIATVTFIYHDDETPDQIEKVVRTYQPYGWLVNGEFHEPETSITITEPVTIEPAYIEGIEDVYIPDYLDREHYEFDGWYLNDTEYYSDDFYRGTEDIELHAHWHGEDVTVCIDEECDEYEYGTSLELDTNDIIKNNETIATVTFYDWMYDLIDHYSFDLYTTSDVEMVFTPNGWLVNGEHYDDNAVITVTEDLTIVPDYIEFKQAAVFPDDPEYEHYTFDGWYDDPFIYENEIYSYDGEDDIELYARWAGDSINICYVDEGCFTLEYGTHYEIGYNNITKADDELATVTFKYHNGDDDTTSKVLKRYTEDGWLINGEYYDHTFIDIEEDLTIEPNYQEEIIEAEFPDDPTYENHEFAGWYTLEDGGDPIDSYSGTSNIDVHAHWTMTLPTEFSIDTEDISIMVGETHQIVVTFTPDGTSDTITYTGYDTSKLSIVDGLVTGLSKGETTITVGLENVPDVTKTITVTIISDRFESDIYEVRDKDPENDNSERIIIGAEPLTTIGEFKDNLLTNNDYIKIYDKDGNEITDDEEVKTGLIIKLEYKGTVVDEAIMVVRGDVNGDGVVNTIDYSTIMDHYLENSEITDFIEFTAGDVVEDGVLNLTDLSKIIDYYLENIDTLNN